MMLVIGYGNTLRGDDGVGQYAAHKLAAKLNRRDIEIVACHQLTPELVTSVSRAMRVIFIDACEGDTPGEVNFSKLEPLTASGAFTHNVTPEGLLGAAKELYGATPEGFLFSVCGADFEIGEHLSPVVGAALPKLVERIEQMIIGAFH